MANTNSNLITQLEATPPSVSDVAVYGGRKRAAVDTFEVAAADFDADGDTVVLARLPERARILSIKTYNDDLDTGANSAVNIGIARADGTIEDEDAFASAVTTFQAADTTGTEHRFESDVNDIDTINDPLYTLAGNSQGDFPVYDIVMYQTAAVAGAQAGTVSFVIEYVVD